MQKRGQTLYWCVWLLPFCLLTSCRTIETKSFSPISVTVEQLLSEPATYTGQRIEVSGIWVKGWEWSYFCRDPLNESGSPIWLEPWMIPRVPAMDAQAIARAKSDARREAGLPENSVSQRFWIRCIALFEHKESIEPAEGDYSYKGFGHLNRYPSQMTLERILEIKALAEP